MLPPPSGWRWRQHGSPKCSCPTTWLHSVTTHVTTCRTFIPMKTSSLSHITYCNQFWLMIFTLCNIFFISPSKWNAVAQIQGDYKWCERLHKLIDKKIVDPQKLNTRHCKEVLPPPPYDISSTDLSLGKTQLMELYTMTCWSCG